MVNKRNSRKKHIKYGGVDSDKNNLTNTSNVTQQGTVGTVGTVGTAEPVTTQGTVGTPGTQETVLTPETVTPQGTPETVETSETMPTPETMTPEPVVIPQGTQGTVGTVGTQEPNTNVSVFIYNTTQISTQPNTDTNYKEVGIIHVTESSAINIARNFVTNISNAFGAQGFDNTIFDSARNQALQKLNEQLTDEHKVSNLRMELSNDPNLIFVHLYGTLLLREYAE